MLTGRKQAGRIRRLLQMLAEVSLAVGAVVRECSVLGSFRTLVGCFQVTAVRVPVLEDTSRWMRWWLIAGRYVAARCLARPTTTTGRRLLGDTARGLHQPTTIEGGREDATARMVPDTVRQ